MTGFFKRLHEANRQAFDWLADELSVIPGHIEELGDLFNDLILHHRQDDGIVTEEPTVTPLQEVDPYTRIEIGFPEGQILPYCDGDTALCGELSEAFHLGEAFPETGDNRLDAITARLRGHSGYGAFGRVIGGNSLTDIADTFDDDCQIGDALSNDLGNYGETL